MVLRQVPDSSRRLNPSLTNSMSVLSGSMRMPVMNIRKVWVFVNHRLMPVPMFVGLLAGPCERMVVVVVLVVDMAVAVFHRLVHMFVFVVLGEVQPYAPSHEGGREPERARGRLAQQHQ